MNNFIFTGIVESNLDPLKLDRVQVRVFGVHTEILDDVPTASLPWALALVTGGASVSGVGNSGPAYLPGSLVLVFFLDGESKQQPVILGSAPGIPISQGAFPSSSISENVEMAALAPQVKTNSTVQATSRSTLVDSSGAPVTDSSGTPISTGSVDVNAKLKAALGFKESTNNYKAVNQLGYIGKYQMGAPMLTDLGYVKRGTRNSDLNNPDNWTGKDGVTSKDSFLGNSTVQESAMDAELVMNEKRLTKLGVIDQNSTAQEKAGYLATSHLLGTGGARDMKAGITKSDANGVTGKQYYDLGYSAVTGASPKVAPDATTKDNPSREKSVVPDVGVVESGQVAGNTHSVTQIKRVGFSDPASKYPKYLKEQDTNRLARNQNIDKTIVPQKEESEDKGVSIANGKGTWDQSSNPYNARYPHNKVMETESGHIMEFDDTPSNERVHIWHKMGTFIEIDRNGTMVRKIVGDSYEILERNGYVHIKGNVNITVEGDANIRVGNNCELEIDGDLNANIGGSANWSVAGDWKVKAGGSNNQSAGGDFAIDASNVHLNSGESTAGSLSTPSRGAQGSIDLPPLTLEPRGFTELSEFESDELSTTEAIVRNQALQDAGLIDTNPIPPVESVAEKVPENTTPTATAVECSAFISGNININDYITANFRLSDLTKGQKIPVQQGSLKDTELACNLKMLAQNVLEAVKSKYPDMIITSGLRPMGSNPNSQHPLGMAADLQFTTKKSADYINIARDIYSSVQCDQLILEYRSDKRRNGEPTTWIHVSFSSKGNRKQLFTMNSDKRISNFGELKLIT